MTIERIKLQPEEIVELVEDRLAWLAIASTGKHKYVQDFFRRAIPTIELGSRASGIIDVAGVEADEDHNLMKDDPIFALAHHAAGKALNRLGERFALAKLEEKLPTDSVAADFSTSSHKVLQKTDFADVPVADEHESYRTAHLKGVQYQLSAMGMLSKADGQRLLKGPMAQLPCILYQQVTQLKDGRSVSECLAYGLTSNGLLACKTSGSTGWSTLNAEWTKLAQEMEVPHEWQHRDNPATVHPLQFQFDDFVVTQFLRRREWTVELSLDRRRTGVGLATDALGARELIHAMNLDGSTKPSRRSALLHWVREHMRRQRSGSESVVRAHLRGKQELQAGSYWATIWPARQDIERVCNGAKFDQATRTP